jgi:hypothetical protein
MWVNFDVPDSTICVTATVIWVEAWPDQQIANIAISRSRLFDGVEIKIPPDKDEREEE